MNDGLTVFDCGSRPALPGLWDVSSASSLLLGRVLSLLGLDLCVIVNGMNNNLTVRIEGFCGASISRWSTISSGGIFSLRAGGWVTIRPRMAISSVPREGDFRCHVSQIVIDVRIDGASVYLFGLLA